MTRFVGFRLYALAYWFVAGFNDPRRVPERIRRRLRRVLEALTATSATATAGSAGPAPRLAPLGLPVALARAGGRVLAQKARNFRAAWELEQARIRLHTNASGDFTLLARDDWERTGGYAEFEMYSMHIDGLLLYSGHYAGLREQYLPFPTYHIEHGGGFRPEVEGSEALYTILEERAIPKTSDEQLMAYIWEMHETARPITFNPPGWGFADETFPETYPLRATQEVA